MAFWDWPLLLQAPLWLAILYYVAVGGILAQRPSAEPSHAEVSATEQPQDQKDSLSIEPDFRLLDEALLKEENFVEDPRPGTLRYWSRPNDPARPDQSGRTVLLYDGNELHSLSSVFPVHHEHWWVPESFDQFEAANGSKVSLKNLLSGDVYRRRFEGFNDIVCVGLASYPSAETPQLSKRRANQLCRIILSEDLFERSDNKKMWTLDLGQAVDETSAGTQAERFQRPAIILGVKFIKGDGKMTDAARNIVARTSVGETQLWRYSLSITAEASPLDSSAIIEGPFNRQ
tara:strand:+ start:6627 stop:7490 length:864 start_codon:yes stop_codon:yes gene_type:complete